MKPKKALLVFLAAFAVVPFPLQAATIDLDLTSTNAGSITLEAGSNTFSYTGLSVDYLIVGGGGSGGGVNHTRAAGGGGAGGLLTGTTSISGVQSISVGAGGIGAATTRGTNGLDSSAFSIVTKGGGAGGANNTGSGLGLTGGSGGGNASSNTTSTVAAGTVDQGNDGGPGSISGGQKGGGGGGATDAGVNITGGAGLSSSITGTATTYATGGDGGVAPASGNGVPGIDGAANTGNGGSGGASRVSGGTDGTGSNGGSGIVIVRYTGDNLLTGGIVTTDGGDTVHQFTTTGASTMGFNATIAGNIDGAGDFEWNNLNSTLTISGNLSHAGSTTTTAGTIILSGDNSTATGPMILNGGVTQFESLGAINGTGANVSINSAGTMAFGSSFSNTDIPAALGRVVTTSTGTVAVDNHANFNFDFDTPGLTAAYLGAVEDLSYTGTLTPQGTTYRLGGGGGTLTMANVNALTGAGNSAVIRSSVILPVANNHDGGTTLSADSTLTLGNDGSLGSGTFTIAGASTIQATGTVVTTNDVAANANFTIGGTGTLTMGGDMTLNANRIITNSNTTNTTSFGAITGTNRTLTFNGDGNTIVSGNITTGTGTLTKNNAGTLTLEGANTYSNTTTISGGTLVLSGSNSSAGATTLNAATLQLNSASNGGLASGLLTISQNAGVLQAVNADREISNDVLLNSSPTISGTQSLTINGTMTLNNNRVLTNSISGTGKSLTLATVTGTNRNLTLSGDGDTQITDSLALGTGTLTKNGAGTLILQGANTYTGNTTVSAGILEIGGSGTLGNVSAGVGDYAGNISITNTNSGRLVYNSSATQTLSGVISGNGAVFVEAGTLALANDNTYTGATTVNGGTLLINGSTSTGAVTVGTAGTLGGSGTVGAATTVAGFLNPGNSAGELAFNTTLTLQNTATTTMEIVGLNMVRGVDYDGIDVVTTLVYGGALTLDLGAIFGGGSYTFNLFDLTTATQSGDFTSVALDGLYTGSLVNIGSGVWTTTTNSANETWTFTQSTGDLNLAVIPEPGAALLGGLGMLFLLRRRRA